MHHLIRLAVLLIFLSIVYFFTLKTVSHLNSDSSLYNNCISRAENYDREQKYFRSMLEYQKAVFINSKDERAFIGLSVEFEMMGYDNLAIQYAQKAVQVNPYNSTACYNLGRHYAKRRQHGDAVKWYEAALKIHPRASMYWHAMGRSYQGLRDKPNAVRCFQEYLKLEPHGEHVQLVKGYLITVHAEIPKKGMDLTDLLTTGQYDALEKLLNRILKEKKINDEGFSLLSFSYDELCWVHDNPETWKKYLEDWYSKTNGSHFSGACLGAFYVDYAWYSRGCGWAPSVTSQGWKLFQERLTTARDYLEKSYLKNTSDPMVPTKLIIVAKGLDLGNDEMEKQFQRAMRANNRELAAYYAKLDYLKPKWHGSEKEMFAFARETVRTAPSDSLAPVLLGSAHWEMYYQSKKNVDYFKRPGVWPELKHVYTMLCERFPKSRIRHNWFAVTAYLAGDYETAKKELRIIKDNWDESAWGDYVYFNTVRTKLLGNTTDQRIH